MKKQKGFALIEILIIALVLSAIGGLTYYALRPKPVKRVAPTNTIVNPAQSSSPSPSQTPPVVGKYTVPTSNAELSTDTLPIPELGVQITLPVGLAKSDVIYRAVAQSKVYTDGGNRSYHQLGSVYLSTKSLSSKQTGCGIAANQPGLIAFGKTKEDLTNYQIASNSKQYTAVGDFYMSIFSHQSVCSESDADIPLELQQYSLFQQAFQTIRPL